MNQSQDIDLRRKTLEALHDSAVDAIVTITERGIIETVNPATEILFGYTPQELVGKNVSMLMPDPYRSEHDGYLVEYLKTRKRKIIGVGREVVAQKKDGSIFPMHLAVSEVQVGERRVFAGFIRDHSDLKRYEEQQASLGRIIEDSLNEVFIFDPVDLNFIQVNRGARQNLGYTLEELHRLTPIDIKPEFTEDDFRALIQPLMDGEVEKLQISTVHLRKDGTTYDVDINLQMSTYLSKSVFVAIILDVTERRKAERQVQNQQEEMQAELKRQVDARTEELRQAQEDLVRSEKFATLGKVSGGIAHEIRNPLNAVKTSAYFLLNAKELPPDKVKEHLDRIDRQVTIVDNVITALSDVAKLPEADRSPISIEKLCRSVASSIKIPANVIQEFDFADDLPKVLADEQQMAIALRNLLRNARDAMPNGGRISLGAAVRDGWVVLSIKDTGEGIADEHLEKIMEPLFTTKARGMGLGLSITRAIVEKNLAKITVQSELGVGSQFDIALRSDVPGA